MQRLISAFTLVTKLLCSTKLIIIIIRCDTLCTHSPVLFCKNVDDASSEQVMLSFNKHVLSIATATSVFNKSICNRFLTFKNHVPKREFVVEHTTKLTYVQNKNNLIYTTT